MTKNTPYELSLVVLVKNWFRVVSVNNNGVRKVCREVFFAGACAGKIFLPGRVPGRVPGQTSTQITSFPTSVKKRGASNGEQQQRTPCRARNRRSATPSRAP